MSHFYPGIVAIKINTGGGLSPRISARYWRLDNFSYHSSITQIRGLWFATKDSTGWTKLNPSSITNDTGDVTAAFDSTSHTTITTVDAITYFEFDMGVSVAPEQLVIFGNEWDTDYIVSADLSYSDDGITWTKVSEFNADDSATGQARVNYDGTSYPTRPIRPPNGQALITSSHVGIVSGRRTDAMTITRGEIIVLSGRHPAGVAIVTGNLYVITTPV